MKTLKKGYLKMKSGSFKTAIYGLALLSLLSFMTACTAEELPVAQDQEIIIPTDGIEVDGSVQGVPPILGGSTSQPPKK
jgi:hypothetical protein